MKAPVKMSGQANDNKPSLQQITQRLLGIYQPVAIKQKSILINNVPPGLTIEADKIILFKSLGSILHTTSRLSNNTRIKISAKAYHDVVLMHIKDSSTCNSYAVLSEMPHLQLLAGKIGGFIEVTSQRKKETTIAFSFINRPEHYHIIGVDRKQDNHDGISQGDSLRA
jgi:hypothetical protein